MADNTLKPQTSLRDYVIKRVLGRGSFGVTYLAENISDHLAVAIKEYFPVSIALRDEDGTTVNVSTSSPDENQEFQAGLDKFLEESRTLSGFKSPHIVQVVDTFEYNGTAYMVMKYEEGGTLNRYLESHQEPLKEGQIFSVFIPLLEGLRTIHAKWLLHRDIKPENIYIRKDGSPLLIDFGTARHALSAKHGGMTEYLTPGFAPPEQYDRNADHGPWTDIYAVGATMYYCVTRIKPYEGRFRTADNDPVISATKAAPALYDTGLLEAIDWMMDPDYQSRPQSVEEVLLRLQELQAESSSESGSKELAEGVAEAKTAKRSTSSARGRSESRAGSPRAEKTRKRGADTEKVSEPAVGTPPVPAGGKGGRLKWIAAGAMGIALVLAGTVYLQMQWAKDALIASLSSDRAASGTESGNQADTKSAADDEAAERAEAEARAQAEARAEAEARVGKAWEEARATDSVRSYREFAERYPDSSHAASARRRLKELEALEAQQRLEKEVTAAWKTAQERNTVDALKAFTRSYPDSKFVTLANARIEDLEQRQRDQERKQAEQNAKRMNDGWRKAVVENTPTAYLDFMEKYPDSTYEKLALAKLAGLEKEFWRSAQTRNTSRAYQEFIELYPDSALRTLAEARLKTLE